MTTRVPATLGSASAAMDGGFIAISDVANAMSDIGAHADYRLIGGVAVLLHIQRVGNVVTTEVPGLAVALRRPGIVVAAALRLTNRETRDTTITIPDALAMLILKARARTVRDEERDAQDLWRCLDIAAADGVTPLLIDAEAEADLRDILRRELGPGGASLAAITRGMQPDAAARLRTRIRSLLADVIGVR